MSGNTSTKSVAVTVTNAPTDTTPPAISISTPASGASVVGTVAIKGAASDNVGVARVDVAIDGGGYQAATGTTSWSWSWSTAAYANGTHSVSARATDTAGNVTPTAVTVNVANGGDTTGPTVTITSPAAGATIAGLPTVSGTASDNVGVASVRVAVDGGAWQPANGTMSWSWLWDTRMLANGSHTLAVQATDTGGNLSTIVSNTVTVNNAPPALSTCSDGSAVLQQSVTPEGVRIVVCTTVGGWTTTSIYDLLQPNALDLALIGPHVTVQVQTGHVSSEGNSASCCDASGRYNGFTGLITLDPGSNDSFSAAPDAIVAHEYGHAWTYYWYYMNPANNGSWGAYDNYRWAAANGSQVLSQNANLNTTYSWMDYEMAADDYRRLFGTPAAQSELTFLNASVPDSQQVSGLAAFMLNTWR